MFAMDAAVLERLRRIVAEATSQREFADLMGIEPTKLSKSLHGKRRLTAQELRAAARAGATSLDWLLEGIGEPPATSRPEPGTSALRDESRRSQFLDAASRLIAERGYHAVRMSDIANACGTSTAAVHYHFPTKQDALNAALRHCVDAALERQMAELESLVDARRRLERLIELQLPTPGQVHREWSVWLQFWTETTLRPGLREVHTGFYAKWRETVIDTVKQGQGEAVFRLVDADAFSLAFTAMIDGLAVQILTGVPGADVGRMRATLFDYVEQTLLVRVER